jgi:hypothetical protein
MERVHVLRVELESGVVVGNRPMGVVKSEIDERAVRDRCRMMRPKPQRLVAISERLQQLLANQGFRPAAIAQRQ